MNHNNSLSIISCSEYDQKLVKEKLTEAILNVDDLLWVKPGMRIAIKANLVSGSNPDKAIVTHPVVISALTEILVEKEAIVIVGDSPGGPFLESRMKTIYKASDMHRVERVGGQLNMNLNSSDISDPDAVIMKTATITSWLLEADAIIGVCKLKTHGMMRLSANVKNFFGAIPGTMKAEYHYRFPNYQDFANMLIDINEYLKPRLYITDAITGMEGNGPTNGTPRQIGALLASKNPHLLDIACSRIIDIEPESVPTIKAAMDRMPEKCLYNPDDFSGNPDDFRISDYKNIINTFQLNFTDRFPAFCTPVIKAILMEKPVVKKKDCIGCKRCRDICPAKAITMEQNRPVIDRSLCIRCFCCQEFCPKGAMKVKRSRIARIFQH